MILQQLFVMDSCFFVRQCKYQLIKTLLFLLDLVKESLEILSHQTFLRLYF